MSAEIRAIILEKGVRKIIIKFLLKHPGNYESARNYARNWAKNYHRKMFDKEIPLRC